MMDKDMDGEAQEQSYNSMRKLAQQSWSINNDPTFFHCDMYDLFENLSYFSIKIWRPHRRL